MNKEDAEKLSLLMMQLSSKLDQSVAFVIDKELEEMFDNYKLTVGKIMGSLYLDIEEKIWKKYVQGVNLVIKRRNRSL